MPEHIKVVKECIDIDEVKQALQANKKIQIIDVRSKEEYEKAHIPNALNISLQELKNSITQLDNNFQFVTTCGKGGGRSADGAKLLKENGLIAIWLCGGTNKWLNING